MATQIDVQNTLDFLEAVWPILLIAILIFSIVVGSIYRLISIEIAYQRSIRKQSKEVSNVQYPAN